MELILGTAQLDKNYGIKKKGLNKQELKYFFDHKKSKIKFIDTAISYEISNKRLCNFNLKKYGIIIKTKLNRKFINKVENQLKLLKINKFESVLAHDENELINRSARKNYNNLLNLKKNNFTKSIGVSVYSLKNCLKIISKFDLDFIQVPGNIFDRRFFNKKLLSIVKRKKIKIVYRSIFFQGLLLDKKLIRKIFKKKIPFEFDNFFNWIKHNNLTSLEACIYFILFKKIKNVVIGFCSFKEYKQVLKILTHKRKFIFPNFVKDQDDNNKLLRPDLWHNIS